MRAHVVVCYGCRNRLFIRIGSPSFINKSYTHSCIYCNKPVDFSGAYIRTFNDPINFLDINDGFLDIKYTLTALKYR